MFVPVWQSNDSEIKGGDFWNNMCQSDATVMSTASSRRQMDEYKWWIKKERGTSAVMMWGVWGRQKVEGFSEREHWEYWQVACWKYPDCSSHTLRCTSSLSACVCVVVYVWRLCMLTVRLMVPSSIMSCCTAKAEVGGSKHIQTDAQSACLGAIWSSLQQTEHHQRNNMVSDVSVYLSLSLRHTHTVHKHTHSHTHTYIHPCEISTKTEHIQ